MISAILPVIHHDQLKNDGKSPEQEQDTSCLSSPMLLLKKTNKQTKTKTKTKQNKRKENKQANKQTLI